MRNVGEKSRRLSENCSRNFFSGNFLLSHLLIAYSFSMGPAKLELFFIIRRRIVCDSKRLIHYRIVFVEKPENSRKHEGALTIPEGQIHSWKGLESASFSPFENIYTFIPPECRGQRNISRWVCRILQKEKVSGNFVCRKKEMKV